MLLFIPKHDNDCDMYLTEWLGTRSRTEKSTPGTVIEELVFANMQEYLWSDENNSTITRDVNLIID